MDVSGPFWNSSLTILSENPLLNKYADEENENETEEKDGHIYIPLYVFGNPTRDKLNTDSLTQSGSLMRVKIHHVIDDYVTFRTAHVTGVTLLLGGLRYLFFAKMQKCLLFKQSTAIQNPQTTCFPQAYLKKRCLILILILILI